MGMSEVGVIEVLEELERGGIAVSVAGGWAVDALLGHTTRAHGDLDLAIDASLVDRAIEALASLGLAIAVDERPARLVLHGGGRTVDLHPVTWSSDGMGRQVGLAGEVFEYPRGSTDAVGQIAGRRIRCLTPELLVRFHEGYEPRPIDRADVSALADRFELELPAVYREGSGH